MQIFILPAAKNFLTWPPLTVKQSTAVLVVLRSEWPGNHSSLTQIPSQKSPIKQESRKWRPNGVL